MKIEQEFTVTRSVDAVWQFFQDIAAVSQCLPGAELIEDRGDGTYVGKVEAKLGPMTATFEGDATVTPNEETKSGHISGKGADRRGGSRGQVAVDYRLEPDGDGTHVYVDADVTLSGSAAQFGRTGLIKEISNRLVADFVLCLEGKLGAETIEEAQAVTAADVKPAGLLLSSLWAAVVNFFKKLFGKS